MNKDNWDDFEIDFKPLNEGLGFNHGDKKVPFEKSRLERKKFVESNLSKNVMDIPSNPFEQTRRIGDALADIDSSEFTISIFRKLLSWIIDSVTILFFAVFCSRLIFFISFKQSLDFYQNLDFTVSVFLPLVFFFYIFYFSILWKCFQQTIGMVFTKLEIVSAKSPEVRLTQTFSRSFFSFLSIFSIGIFDILGITDLLSWTKVKKC
jgi:uncharacterized RDD family membrane protein YckC